MSDYFYIGLYSRKSGKLVRVLKESCFGPEHVFERLVFEFKQSCENHLYYVAYNHS